MVAFTLGSLAALACRSDNAEILALAAACLMVRLFSCAYFTQRSSDHTSCAPATMLSKRRASEALDFNL